MSSLIQIELPYQPSSEWYFTQLQRWQQPVWLDSGHPTHQSGHFDILAANPRRLLKQNHDGCFIIEQGQLQPFNGDVASLLKQWLNAIDPQEYDHLPFCGGLIGYLGYEPLHNISNSISNPATTAKRAANALPQRWIGQYDWCLIQDHHQQRCYWLGPEAQAHLATELSSGQHRNPTPDKPFQLTSAFISNTSYAEYRRKFNQVQQYIQAGDCYQVNLAMRYQAHFNGSAYAAYRALRDQHGTPFGGFLDLGDSQILSLSPEQFLTIKDGHITTKPIKGTRPRFSDANADEASRQALINSAKDRAENLMIVDLLRNDIGKCSQTGSVSASPLFAIESFSAVHHLVSQIEGDMCDNLHPLDVLLSCSPGGSITGAPKIRAMQIIEELEADLRGIYCGSLFHVDGRGRLNSNICIRTLLCQAPNIYCWGGGGLVAESEAEAEYREISDKIGPLMATLSQM